jgi:hypothetical protein
MVIVAFTYQILCDMSRGWDYFIDKPFRIEHQCETVAAALPDLPASILTVKT